VEASDAAVADKANLGDIGGVSTPAIYFKLITVIYVGLFVYFCSATRVLDPYSDLLDLIDFYFRNGQGADVLSYLLEPHGYYHRIPWLRLQVAADVSLFGGKGLAFVLPAALGLAGVAWLLARQVAESSGDKLKLPATALTLALVLTSANAADVSTPASTSYVQTVVFAVLAMLFATARQDLSPRAAFVAGIAALACACGAAFGNAVGLVVWPALAFCGWRAGRTERTWFLTVALAGAAFVGLYVSGLTMPSTTGELPLSSLTRPLDYFIAYLGLPWVRASGVLGRMIGGLLLAAATVAVFKSGGPGATRAERLGLSLVLFSLGTAALAAIGRSGETAVIDIPVRYAMLLAPLHVGLLLLGMPWLRRVWTARPRTVQAAILAGLAALLVQQVFVGMVAARAGARTRDAIARFERGERTPDMTALIHPDLARATAIDAEIRRRSEGRAAVP
jgi:hypothetical protein